MNIDTSKLTSEELKIYNKFNKSIEPKIKKLDFNFTDMKKGELMLISTPKDIVKFIKKIPPAKKYNFKDIRLKLAKKSKADNTCPVTFGIFLRLAIEYSILEAKYLKLKHPNFPFWRVEYDKKSNVYKKINNFENLLNKYDLDRT